ncbi:MAG: cysteine desulfurase [Polyangiaceae bacterium]|nr:cysteine desulfurase [Polyangiaceae bacterium]
MPEPIYLDHNATTPLLPEALDAMLPYLRGKYGNPSSVHSYGREARAAVEQARAQVAALITAAPEEVFFTSGGTESNNLALRGLAAARPEKKHIVTSNVEHPAIAKVCTHFEENGYRVTRVPVNGQGRIAAEEALAALDETTLLVTVMHAHNETGVIQPIGEIAKVAREKGVFVHTDAAQSLGKVAVSVEELGLDLLSMAAHKLYGPKGVGALYVRKGTPILPFALGAGHERGKRPGTENVASIVGFGVACEAARRDAEWLGELLGMMRNRLWKKLSTRVEGMRLNGEGVDRLPNTLSVRFPGVKGPELLALVPDVAASTGAACHDGKDVASSGILALGVPSEEAMGTVRLTLGRHTTDAQVDKAAELLTTAWKNLTGRS